MDNANFIPLGEGRTAESSGPRNEGPKKKETEWGPKINGKTPAERKAIARDIRLKLRKEKKQAKSAAKAARKVNGALHRKLSKNTEKYSKNKERNKQRAIDVERLKIRNAAVRQAERLAAIHDPSGKTFNVGEIITLPGGIVKTKEAIRKAAEAAEQKEKEEAERKAADLRYKNAESAVKLEAEEAQKAAEEGRPVPTRFPAKEVLKGMKRPKRISKKQLQRQEMLKRLQETPPKPIIPAGISLPEGEENMLALWDIPDTDITKRLHEQKKQKSLARKDLKKIQKEAKKLKKELKIRKRQAEKEGTVFDKAEARKEILAEQAALQAQMAAARALGTRTKSESESGSDSGSHSDSESESDNEARIGQGGEDKVVAPEKPPADLRKLDLDLIEKAAEIERAHEAKKLAARQKRRQERREKQTEVEGKAEVDAENAKKRRKAARKAARLRTAESSGGDSSSKKRKRDEAEDDGGVEAAQEGKGYKSHKKQKSKSESAVQEPEVEKAEIETEADSKKREKKAKREAKALKAAEEEASREMTEAAPPKKDKKTKKGSGDGDRPGHGAEQWHPEALSGDAARKDKFLRLLGAGKEASKETEKGGKKSTKRPEVDIDKIAADLERQFEAGTKMKHDGGGKRRGLGS